MRIKTCTKCKVPQPHSSFTAQRKGRHGLRADCKSCVAAAQRARNSHNGASRRAADIAYRQASPERALFVSARQRAQRKNRPFTIVVEDIVIPDYCPLTGTTLVSHIGAGCGAPDSPSLDCIIPALGYVPGNVWVISNQANVLKGGITPTMARLLLEEVARRGLEDESLPAVA